MSLLRGLGLTLLLLHTAAAQTPAHRPAPSRQASRQTPAQPTAAEALASLQRTQLVALQSGEASQIASATRPYLAELLQQLGLIAALEGAGARAAGFYTDAVALADTPQSRVDAAAALLRAGQAAKARDLLTPMLEGPLAQDARAWTLAGMAARAAENDREAVVDFEHALRLNQDIQVAYSLGAALLAVRDEARAEAIFREILRDSHQSATWEIAIGDAYREARFYDQAVTHFKAAIARDPAAPHAEFLLGLTYLELNEWGVNSQSFEHLRRAVANAPKEYISNFYLGALESTDGSDLASSDRHLRAAAAADPSQPEVWLYLGLNANREHRPDDAETALRRSIKLTGVDESRNNFQVRRAYFALGRLLVSQGKREEGQQFLARYKAAEARAVAASGDFIAHQTHGEGDAPAVALTASAKIAAVAPGSAASALAQLPQGGAAALQKEKSELARMAADAWNDLGTAEARQQDYASALASFQHAESLGTPSPAMLRNLGVAAFRLHQSAEAVRGFNRYFQATPERQGSDGRAQLMLGLSQFDLGHFAPAAKAFAAAPAETLQDPRAAYSWAYALAHTGSAQEANALARKLMQQPLPPEVRSLVCHLYVDDEDYEDSLQCFRSISAQEASTPLAHYEAAQALIHLDRAQEAIDELKAEQALSPGNANVDYTYAYALLQLSRKQEAKALLVTLVAAHPEHAQAQYQLGKLLLDGGDAVGAIQHLEAAEAADATSDYTHYQLGTAYRKAGRAADAEREFKLYREIKDRKRDAAAAPAAH